MSWTWVEVEVIVLVVEHGHGPPGGQRAHAVGAGGDLVGVVDAVAVKQDEVRGGDDRLGGKHLSREAGADQQAPAAVAEAPGAGDQLVDPRRSEDGVLVPGHGALVVDLDDNIAVAAGGPSWSRQVPGRRTAPFPHRTADRR